MFLPTTYFFVRKKKKRGLLKEKRKKRWRGLSEHREASLHSCSFDFDGIPARDSVVDLVEFLLIKL
jgi:hypothetical protein